LNLIIYGVISIILLVLFSIVTILVLYGDQHETSFFQVDKFLLSLTNMNVPILDNLMIVSSLYGREIFWFFMIVMLSLLGGIDGRKTALFLVLSILIIAFLNTMLKDLIQRPRPEVSADRILVPQDKEFSFPSGHASIVAGCAVTTAILFSNSERRKIIVCFVMLEAALVCLSRVYVGVHYPSDILGGILLGAGISLGLIAIRGRIYQTIDFMRNFLKKT
jgi:membrane-associated phospholipid phosphatase